MEQVRPKAPFPIFSVAKSISRGTFLDTDLLLDFCWDGCKVIAKPTSNEVLKSNWFFSTSPNGNWGRCFCFTSHSSNSKFGGVGFSKKYLFFYWCWGCWYWFWMVGWGRFQGRAGCPSHLGMGKASFSHQYKFI